MTEPEEISPEAIRVAIFCALTYEAVAVRYCLDSEAVCHLTPGRPRNYVYIFGRIGRHNIVVAQPHQMGTVEAALCAAEVSQQFPNVKFALMVGIGAGIPQFPIDPERDIRLGDVAVGIPGNDHPGVIQYDYGKYERDRFVRKGSLNNPPGILTSADAILRQDAMMDKNLLVNILENLIKKPKFARPKTADLLFEPCSHHVKKGSDCKECEVSSGMKLVHRDDRHPEPVVHRGLILSGNGVIKDPHKRDELCRNHGEAICFEMEAAGIVNEIPCLVVRGICDYADTHKQDGWHYYAAAVAAAYCSALLHKVDHEELDETESMSQLMRSGLQQILGSQR